MHAFTTSIVAQVEKAAAEAAADVRAAEAARAAAEARIAALETELATLRSRPVAHAPGAGRPQHPTEPCGSTTVFGTLIALALTFWHHMHAHNWRSLHKRPWLVLLCHTHVAIIPWPYLAVRRAELP